MEETREFAALGMASRPAVPLALKRDLYEEAGYRCGVPTCRGTSGLQMEHIDDWAKVKKHEFENMIILCAVCHARVTSKEIPKSSIKNYKRNLAVTNGRYSMYEMRVLEFFHDFFSNAIDANEWKLAPMSVSYKISEGDQLHVKGLVDDGYLKLTTMLNTEIEIEAELHAAHGPLSILLTQQGFEFVLKLFGGESIFEEVK